MKTKKLKRYRLPLIERILMIFFAIGILSFPICLIILLQGYVNTTVETIVFTIFVTIVVILLSTYILFSLFNDYICLDYKKGKFIYKKFLKKKETPIPLIKEIRFADGVPHKTMFTLEIVCHGFTESISAWSYNPYSKKIVLFIYRRQKRRLLNFAAKCNEMLVQNKT